MKNLNKNKSQFGPVLILSFLLGIIGIAVVESMTHDDRTSLAAGIGTAIVTLLIAALHCLYLTVLRLTEIRDILKKQGEAEKGKSQSA